METNSAALLMCSPERFERRFGKDPSTSSSSAGANVWFSTLCEVVLKCGLRHP